MSRGLRLSANVEKELRSLPLQPLDELVSQDLLVDLIIRLRTPSLEIADDDEPRVRELVRDRLEEGQIRPSVGITNEEEVDLIPTRLRIPKDLHGTRIVARVVRPVSVEDDEGATLRDRSRRLRASKEAALLLLREPAEVPEIHLQHIAVSRTSAPAWNSIDDLTTNESVEVRERDHANVMG